MTASVPYGDQSDAARAGISAQSGGEVDIEGVMDAGPPIRTRPQAECHVCGGKGEIAYTGLRDRLFDVPGEWTLRRCKDPACGLLWLDPMPVEEDLPRLYAAYYTHDEAAQPTNATGLRRSIEAAYLSVRYGYLGPRSVGSALLAALLKLSPGHRAQADVWVFGLAAKPGGRLLDVGCGGGAAMIRMRNLGWEVAGIDFDAKAVQRARSHGLDVRLGGLEEQGYAEGTFDAVVTSHVLEHVSNPRALLQECWRVLKPGGNLVCITPNASSSCHRMYGRDWRGLEPPRHLHLFTVASLSRLAECAEWDSLSVGATIANTHGMLLVSRDMARGKKREGGFKMYEQLGARVFQAFVYFRHRFHSNLGEELIVHGSKVGRT